MRHTCLLSVNSLSVIFIYICIVKRQVNREGVEHDNRTVRFELPAVSEAYLIPYGSEFPAWNVPSNVAWKQDYGKEEEGKKKALGRGQLADDKNAQERAE